MADADLEILHQPRKRRIDVDANVAISLDSPYQAPGTKDVAGGTGSLLSQQKSSNVSYRNNNTCPL